MAAARHTTSAQIARIVRNCLEGGRAVEIDGLGAFRPDSEGGFRFEPQVCPKVFLAYVAEDHRDADRLYEAFRSRGFDAWLDRRKLLPGQNWPRAIDQAISVSDFFVACFSERSIAKRGMFYSELRHALDCATRLPMEEVYFIPVRLRDCRVPPRIQQEYQYVDLFPNWDEGFERVLTTMRKQLKNRGREAA
jgi:TIR domain